MTDRHDNRSHASETRESQGREAYARGSRSRQDDEFDLDGDLDARPAPTAKERRCLRCSTTFLSAWAGERVCPRCKSTAAWRAGTPPASHPSSKR